MVVAGLAPAMPACTISFIRQQSLVRVRLFPLAQEDMQRSSPLYMPLRKWRTHLEVKLVDVCAVENGWWAKQDHVTGGNCIATQFASRERLADIPFDLSLNQQGRDIISQVTQVGGIPQLKALDRAIFHILAQLIWRTKTCQSHLASFLHRLE